MVRAQQHDARVDEVLAKHKTACCGLCGERMTRKRALNLLGSCPRHKLICQEHVQHRWFGLGAARCGCGAVLKVLSTW